MTWWRNLNADFDHFIRHHKKWWLPPVLILYALLALVVWSLPFVAFDTPTLENQHIDYSEFSGAEPEKE